MQNSSPRETEISGERNPLAAFSHTQLFSFSDKHVSSTYDIHIQVLVLGREKEGIPVDIIHMLDACIEIPQLGVIRSLNVHVSGAIALWEYTRQQRMKKC